MITINKMHIILGHLTWVSSFGDNAIDLCCPAITCVKPFENNFIQIPEVILYLSDQVIEAHLRQDEKAKCKYYSRLTKFWVQQRNVVFFFSISFLPFCGLHQFYSVVCLQFMGFIFRLSPLLLHCVFVTIVELNLQYWLHPVNNIYSIYKAL